MGTYLQSNFDKAFIKVVEYLYSTRDRHLKFRTRKELMEKLSFRESTYSIIKSGERGVPTDKIDNIRKCFKEEFGINPLFMDTNRGEMFLNGQAAPLMDKDTEIEHLQKDVATLKTLVDEKERFITLLQETIKGNISDVKNGLADILSNQKIMVSQNMALGEMIKMIHDIHDRLPKSNSKLSQ